MNKIFINGKIYTMRENDAIVSALYVENGLIKKTGCNEEILAMKKNDDEVIDLHNKAVVPGFNDSHMHLLMYGQSLNQVDLFNVKSQHEVIERGLEFLRTHKIGEGQWLIGRGWNHEAFENKKMLNKYDLDKISTEIPILFSRACCHIVSCNSKALEIAGINANTHVDGGEIEVVDGETTGVLKERAGFNVYSMLSETKRKDRKNDLLLGIKKLSSYGITSIHSDDDITDNDYDIIDIYNEIESEHKMDVRVYQQCRFNDVCKFDDFIQKVYENYKVSENFKLGSLKIISDGSLGGRTALMNEPYSDNNNTKGIAIFTQENLDELIEKAHENNIPVAIHAIGDKAIDMAIEGIEKAQNKNYKKNIRHGIIHSQITSKDALEKYRDDNIIAYIQPIFIDSDSKIAEIRVGERVKYSYNWKTLHDYGVMIPFGTDSPVESPNPFENIYCAVMRTDLEGKPEGGWLPEQKLSVKESVKAYTYDSAYAAYEENTKGTLEEGKYADMAVLSEDIFEINPEKIKDIYCIMTIKNGEIVYER